MWGEFVFTSEPSTAIVPSMASLFVHESGLEMAGRVMEAKFTAATGPLNRWNTSPPWNAGPRLVTVRVAPESIVIVGDEISPLLGTLVVLIFIFTAPPSSILLVMLSKPVTGTPLVLGWKPTVTVTPLGATTLPLIVPMPVRV